MKSPITAALAIALLIGLTPTTAMAQDDTNGDDGDLDLGRLPLDNVKTGALQARAPGNWTRTALQRSREITQENPKADDFLPQLYAAMLQAFFDEITTFLNSITTLLDLGSLFGDLGDLVVRADNGRTNPANLYEKVVIPNRSPPTPPDIG